MPWKCIPSRKTIFLHNPYILFINGEMENDRYIIDMIRLVMQQKDCSLLIIMESYRGAELLGVYFNEFMQESNFPVAAIEVPGFGDARQGFMADINIYTGAEIIANDLIQLGQAESASTIEFDKERYQQSINRLLGIAEEDIPEKVSVVEWKIYVAETMQNS